MKVGIDMGHTLSGAGTGAVGIVKETDKNREVGNRLIAMLQEKGHAVVNCTVDKSSNDLADRVRLANAQTLDLFVSLHLNAYQRTNSEMGVETYHYAGCSTGNAKAQAIQNELVAKVGWKNRGVKTADFYVLRNTTAVAVLAELGFCDSQGDMNKWNTEKIAAALFKGITGVEYVTQPNPPITNPQPNPPIGGSYMVEITASALNYRSGPSNDYGINGQVYKGEVYTIVEVQNGWGKLKSGAGWLYLEYTKKISESAPAPQPTSYLVKITADVLNVRTGPGTSYGVATTVKNGEVYTIVDENEGWGKLKSGAGWIYLGYTKRA